MREDAEHYSNELMNFLVGDQRLKLNLFGDEHMPSTKKLGKKLDAHAVAVKMKNLSGLKGTTNESRLHFRRASISRLIPVEIPKNSRLVKRGSKDNVYEVDSPLHSPAKAGFKSSLFQTQIEVPEEQKQQKISSMKGHSKDSWGDHPKFSGFISKIASSVASQHHKNNGTVQDYKNHNKSSEKVNLHIFKPPNKIRTTVTSTQFDTGEKEFAAKSELLRLRNPKALSHSEC